MPEEPERELLERFVRGDQRAFETLFRQFQSEAYRWVIRIVRNASAAEEVTVDAFWRAYRGRAGFDPTRSFGAWMRRVATNAALDRLKKETSDVAWDAVADTTPANAETDLAVKEALMGALRKLPPKLRAVALLTLVDDRPYAEVADALGVPVGTVKSRVFRATRVLRRELRRLGIRQK